VTLVRLSHDSINEHVVKARRKVEGNDLAGAIASSYTLVEELLKELLRETGTTFNENEGDIRQLYTLAKGKLNLDPKGESLENYLSILLGSQKQVGGLSNWSTRQVIVTPAATTRQTPREIGLHPLRFRSNLTNTAALAGEEKNFMRLSRPNSP
jgi:hypothetical protein